MAKKITPRDMFQRISTILGGVSVEVELFEDDYTVALAEAVDVFRVHSSKAVKYGFAFLELQPGQTTYSLPEQIDTVIEVHRTKAGYLPGNAQFEPFSAAFLQQTLGNGTGVSGGFQGLVNYELAMGYQKMLNRMLGGNIPFDHRRSTNEVMFWYTPRAVETIALHCSELRSIDELIHDQAVFHWLLNYSEAVCRIILGEKYSKFGQQAGPQGGVTLKGDALIARGNEMKEKLVEDLQQFVDGGIGHTAPFWG